MQKKYAKYGVVQMKTKTYFVVFFKCLLSFRAHALQSEHKTGFKFMANKQFRMEKNWEHQYALISHTMLSKTNTFNFYSKKSLNIFF